MAPKFGSMAFFAQRHACRTACNLRSFRDLVASIIFLLGLVQCAAAASNALYFKDPFGTQLIAYDKDGAQIHAPISFQGSGIGHLVFADSKIYATTPYPGDPYNQMSTFAMDGKVINRTLISPLKENISYLQGFAVGDGRIFIPHFYSNTVAAYKTTGEIINLSLITIDQPVNARVRGTELFILSYSGDVHRYTTSGQYINTIRMGFTRSCGACGGSFEIADDSIYISYVNSVPQWQIAKFTMNGTPINRNLIPGGVPTGLVRFAIDGDDLFLLKGDKNIAKYTVNGTLVNPVLIPAPPQAVYSGYISFGPSPYAVTMVDPVPLANNTGLLDSSKISGITMVPNTLATIGREVKGVAADGVAQIVLRIPAKSTSDIIKVTVKPDVTCVGGDSDSYGRVYDALSPPNNIFQTAPTSDNQALRIESTSQGPMAFAVYRAPADFVRSDCPSNREADTGEPQRSVTLVFGNGIPDLKVAIVRPPVMVVHGLWATSGDLGDLTELRDSTQYNQLFQATMSDYGDSDLYKGVTPFLIHGGDLGFEYGAERLLKQMIAIHPDFRKGTNPASLAVASSQYDVVAHSMGNLVTRTMIAELSAPMPFTLLGRGFVHKLISIGGPHLGSPFALEMSSGNNSCVSNIVSRKAGGIYGDCDTCVTARSSFLGSVVYSGSGAVGDLGGSKDGTLLSRALNALKNSEQTTNRRVSTAYVSGILSDSQIESFLAPVPQRRVCTPDGLFCESMGVPNNVLQSLRGLCSGNSLPDKVSNPTSFRLLMSPQSDGVVPLFSQLNGRTSYPIPAIPGLLHSPGTAVLYQSFFQLTGITEPEPTELTGSSLLPAWHILDYVIPLLNTPVTDTNIYVK